MTSLSSPISVRVRARIGAETGGSCKHQDGLFPLWQISWFLERRGDRARALTSQAEEPECRRSLVTSRSQKRTLAVECSVIFTPSGGLLPGVKILGDDDQFGGNSGDRY